MTELLHEYGYIKTIPGAIDALTAHLLEVLRARSDLFGAVALLNGRKYATGHVFQVVTLGYDGPLSVTWERV